MHDAPDLGSIRFRLYRDAGSVLNATFAFIRQNARELATSYVALVIPVLLASALSSALWLSQIGDQFLNPSPEDPFAIFNWTYAGSLLFGLLGGALMQASASGYVRLYRDGEAGSITVSRLWEEAKGLILPYLGMTALFGIVISLAGVINIIPCLGSLAWLAFMVWLFPSYSVAIAVRALEAETIGEAWTRSRELVKGSWGAAFGPLFLAFMVLVLLYFAVSMVIGGVLAVVGMNTTDPTAALGTMGLMLAPLQVLSGAAYLVPLVAAFFVHGRLVEDLEGTSLTDDLDALATGFDPSRPTPPVSTPPAPPEDPSSESPDSPDDSSGGFRGGGFG